VADLQVGPFDFRLRRIASLKTGHYKIEQQENEPSAVPCFLFVEVIRVLASPRRFVEKKRRA
jgi:hypothetical protein